MINKYNARLIEKKQLTKDVFWFKFALKEPEVLNFKAGQYLIFETLDNQSRLYSISSSDYIKNNFELVIQVVQNGAASNYFANLKTGKIVSFQGPAGIFNLQTENRHKIFLATGTGIAPIRSMILSLLNPKLLITNYELPIIRLFWGLKTRDDVYFFDEFKKFSADNQNFNFKICLSREKKLERLDDKYFMLGHINDELLKLKVKNQFEYYVCGSRHIVSSIVDFLKEQGIFKENIFFEKF